MRYNLIITAVLLFIFAALQAETLQSDGDANPARITNYWLGNISSSWDNTQNWSAGAVPTSSDDVYITADGIYHPIISSGVKSAASLTIMPGAQLTIGESSRIIVYSNASISGNLVVTAYTSRFEVRGNLTWQSGSQVNANYFALIECQGDMTFAAGSNVQLLNSEVRFTGNAVCRIINHSPSTVFGLLGSSNSAPGYLVFDEASTHDLTVNDNLVIYGSTGAIRSSYAGNINLKGDLIDQSTVAEGGIRLDNGNLVLDGTSHQIEITTADRYVNNLVVNQTGTVSLQTDINIRGDITINNGSFQPGDKTIYLGGDWIDNAGTYLSFDEGTSTIVFNGIDDQYCNVFETFYILELNKPSGALVLDYQYANVQCYYYKWTSGTVKVLDGKFLASSLMDGNIKGNWHLVDGEILLYNTDSRIDLDGNITIEGGHFQVYSGVAPSYWPYSQNASLTMSGGIFEIMNQSIIINNNPALTLNMNLTGGKIVCNDDFTCNRTDFNPSGGTFEFAGNSSNSIVMVPGSSLSNVIVNKNSSLDDLAAASNLVITGNLTVQRGRFLAGSYLVDCAGEINVNANGILALHTGGTLSMHPDKSLNVNSGGELIAVGSYDSRATFTNPAGYSYYNIESGGTISAWYAVFEKVKSPGLHIKPGAIVNSLYNFNYCTFQDGETGGSLLRIDNDQNFTIRDAIFPANTWNGSANVVKAVDSGVVCFLNATGDFAGTAFEQDSFNRIFWEQNATPSSPDLKILRYEWSNSNPVVGETIQLKVIWANLSIANITQSFSLAYYKNLQAAPTPRTPKSHEFLIAGAGPGHMQEHIFNVTESTNPGQWNSWLWINSDGLITDENENNNLVGPFNITWSAFALPAISDLYIQLVSGNPDAVQLNWTYPQTCDRFNIYRSLDPYFIPNASTLLGSVNYPALTWQETAQAGKYFYVVTAEQD
ncbi:MAG: hypothetical protein R6V77_04850 [Candidatus Cloacimonadaceae bacterium]